MNARRVIIHGRVQGVGYRAWTAKTATRLSLQGWVRNRSDQTVEAVFHGNETALQEMLEACKRGPMMARVDKIEFFAHPEADFTDEFITKPTL